ncbi:hypothetical protein B5S29_g924 [[Candida] boidinii]|nr:hypothetical protein B5S29_g924 [[Candida] boidinii]
MAESLNSIDTTSLSDVHSFSSSTARKEMPNQLNDSLHKIDSNASSIRSGTSRLPNISKIVSRSVHEFIEQVRDDNLQTDNERLELQKTQLGRILTNLEFEDAIKIATHNQHDSGHVLETRSQKFNTEKQEYENLLLNEANGLNSEDEDKLEKLEKVLTVASCAQSKSNFQKVDETVVSSTINEDNLPPVDKGYAWVMCISVFLMLLATWGSSSAYGVFLSYFISNNYYPEATAVDFAIIGGLVLCLAQALSTIAVLLSAIIGTRPTLFIGACFQVAGYILSTFTTKIWQLYLTYGVLIGIGFALIFNSSIVLLPGWFDKYRGLSAGIAVSGAGVGGVVFALSAQKMMNDTGSFQWPMRMIGLVTFFINATVCLFCKSRIPTQKAKTFQDVINKMPVIMNWRVLKIYEVDLIGLWFGLIVIAYVITMYSLSSYCLFIGLTQVQGSHITAIFNGCQGIGRPTIGLTADKFGRINMSLCLTVVVFILIFAMWTNCKDFVSMVFFGILAGLVTGVGSTMNAPLVADACPPELFPSAWSIENIFVGLCCLLSEPVALKLRDMKLENPFYHAQIFSGCMAVASVLCLFPVREAKVHRVLTKRLETTKLQLQAYEDSSSATENITEGENKNGEYPNEEFKILTRRELYYTNLLEHGFVGFMKRLFYPMKV